MKYLVFSDLHGKLDSLEKVIDIFLEDKYDMMIYLGDFLYHGPRNDIPENYNPKACAKIINEYKNKIIWIKGNCDAEVDEMVIQIKPCVYFEMNIGNKTYHFEHGHHLDETFVTHFDYVLYGHTHIVEHHLVDATEVINVGSVSLPKMNNPKTFVSLTSNGITALELDTKQKVFFVK